MRQRTTSSAWWPAHDLSVADQAEPHAARHPEAPCIAAGHARGSHGFASQIPRRPSIGSGALAHRSASEARHTGVCRLSVTPDFTGLLEQAGWPTQPDWDSTEYQPFLDMLDTGQVWRFRVTANPVRVLARTPGDTRRRGRISPHVTADQQRDWLIKSGPTWGFNVPSHDSFGVQAEVRDRHTVRFGRGSAEASRSTVSLSRASFTGLLTIEDPDALRSALVEGMGRAKAYGCGLMTLAPPRP